MKMNAFDVKLHLDSLNGGWVNPVAIDFNIPVLIVNMQPRRHMAAGLFDHVVKTRNLRMA